MNWPVERRPNNWRCCSRRRNFRGVEMADSIAAISGNGDETKTLVVIFLRGAADGLTLVPPIADDNYYRSRPRIGVKLEEAIPLDGLFALHSLLKPLKRS